MTYLTCCPTSAGHLECTWDFPSGPHSLIFLTTSKQSYLNDLEFVACFEPILTLQSFFKFTKKFTKNGFMCAIKVLSNKNSIVHSVTGIYVLSDPYCA